VACPGGTWAPEVAELEVDGPRPAVSWVSSLPADWVSGYERLVLVMLACDAFDNVSAPGGENLMQWTGLSHGPVWDILGRLCQATPLRPALLQRLGADGRPLDGRRGGRTRTRYRLCTYLQPTVQASRTTTATVQASRTVAVNRPGQPDDNGLPTVRQPSGNRPGQPDDALALTPIETPKIDNRAAAKAAARAAVADARLKRTG